MAQTPTPDLAHYYENDPNNPTHFSQDDLDLYKSGEAKLDHYNSTHHSDASNAWRDAGLSDNEKAAITKYTDVTDHWTDRGAPNPTDGTQFNHDTHYNGDPATQTPPTLPPPVAGGEEGNGAVVVNIDALRTFSTNLGTLQQTIKDAMTAVEGVNVKPGSFGMGAKLAVTINGGQTDGLKGSTHQFLYNANEAFKDLQDDIAALILQYNNAEELNGVTGQQLNDVFNESFNDIGGFSSTGNTGSGSST